MLLTEHGHFCTDRGLAPSAILLTTMIKAKMDNLVAFQEWPLILEPLLQWDIVLKADALFVSVSTTP